MIFLRPPSVGGPVVHDGTFITQGTAAVTITASVPSASARTGQVAILTIVSRQNSGNIVLNSSGWTQLNAGGQGNSNQAAMWWKRIVGDETTITATVPNMNTSGGWVVRLDFFGNAGLVSSSWAPIVSTNAVTSKVFQNTVSTMPGSFTLMCATGQTASGGAWTTMTPALDSAGSDAQNYDTGSGRVWISAWKKEDQPVEMVSGRTVSGGGGYVQLFPVTITPMVATNGLAGTFTNRLTENVLTTANVTVALDKFQASGTPHSTPTGFTFTESGTGTLLMNVARSGFYGTMTSTLTINDVEVWVDSAGFGTYSRAFSTPELSVVAGTRIGLKVSGTDAGSAPSRTWTTDTTMTLTGS